MTEIVGGAAVVLGVEMYWLDLALSLGVVGGHPSPRETAHAHTVALYTTPFFSIYVHHSGATAILN